MSVGSDSRYNRSAILNVKDRFGKLTRRPYLDITPRFEDISRQDNRSYRIRDTNDWDELAFKLYGNPDLWHAIAEWNQTINPFEEMEVGKEFTMPSPNAVFLDYLDFDVAVEIEVDDEETR